MIDISMLSGLGDLRKLISKDASGSLQIDVRFRPPLSRRGPSSDCKSFEPGLTPLMSIPSLLSRVRADEVKV